MTTEKGAISFVAGALIAYLFFSPSNGTIQEKSVYYQYCFGSPLHNVYSCPGDTDVMKIRYKVYLDRQMIVGQDGSSDRPCFVFDKDNWRCNKENGRTINMYDGYFYNSGEFSIDEKGQKSAIPPYRQIWAIEYYVRSTIGFFRRPQLRS
jgi:hypothetical protein